MLENEREYLRENMELSRARVSVCQCLRVWVGSFTLMCQFPSCQRIVIIVYYVYEVEVMIMVMSFSVLGKGLIEMLS